MIRVNEEIEIDEEEIELSFMRAGGPGGQHVNKIETAVQLKFDARNSPAISPPVFQRLRRLAGRRMNRDGVILLQARRYRQQSDNRQDAIDRLVKLIREAAQRPKRRRATQPSRSERERRLKAKKIRGDTKKSRGRPSILD